MVIDLCCWCPTLRSTNVLQDRAHRIGQTREVHIFRLITEHSIEENILSKAQQKRNLDILVMDRGKFDASQLFGHGKNAKASAPTDEAKEVFSKGGLRAILGVEKGNEEDGKDDDEKDSSGISTEQVEKAMTSLEDADDVVALRGAQKEAADELKEFDESIEYKKDSDGEDENDTQGKGGKKTTQSKSSTSDEGEKTDEADLEKEFASWQNEVGMDASAIRASLSPMERYGLRFRETVDPYYSIYAVMEYRRKLEAAEESDDDMDIDEIEKRKGCRRAPCYGKWRSPCHSSATGGSHQASQSLLEGEVSAPGK